MNNKEMTAAREKLSLIESKLDTFLSQHNLDEITKKRNLYKSAKRKKLNITSELKSANSAFHIIYGLPRNYKNYKTSATKIAHHYFRILLF